MIVRLGTILQIASIDSKTDFSFFQSKAEVASSRINIEGFLRKALEKAILCFSPPESLLPCVPTTVSSPFSNLSTIGRALHSLNASLISSSVAYGHAKSIFALIVSLKRTGS